MDETEHDSKPEAVSVPMTAASFEATQLIDKLTSQSKLSTSLLESLQRDVQSASEKKTDIEKQSLNIEATEREIEARLAIVKDAVATIQQHVDSTNALIGETSILHEKAKVTGDQVTEAKAQIVARLESAQASLGTIIEGVSRVEAIKTQAEQTATVIATRSEHIESGRLHADKVRNEIDTISTQAQQSATGAEAHRQAAASTAEAAATLCVSIQTAKASIDSNAEAITTLVTKCEEYARVAKRLADIAEATDKKVREYETRLAELEKVAGARLKTIEGLLPGATSAGLASAFNQRRSNFKWPQVIWQCVFVLSIMALAFIAWKYSVYASSESPRTLGALGLSLLHHLPFALPFIWLAIHSSHKGALAQRIEEDYAFKETVSASFEGYRREMAELEGKSAPQSVLSSLCVGVLSIVTNPPGRLYEKHRLNNTPLTAIADSAGPIADAASRVIIPPVPANK